MAFHHTVKSEHPEPEVTVGEATANTSNFTISIFFIDPHRIKSNITLRYKLFSIIGFALPAEKHKLLNSTVPFISSIPSILLVGG